MSKEAKKMKNDGLNDDVINLKIDKKYGETLKNFQEKINSLEEQLKY